jgi:hypothetical protein
MAERLAEMKSQGSYANTEFKVQELQEYDVQPTNLDKAPADKAEEGSSEMPWD